MSALSFNQLFLLLAVKVLSKALLHRLPSLGTTADATDSIVQNIDYLVDLD